MDARTRVVAYRHPSDFGGMGVAADTFIPWLCELSFPVYEINLSAPGRPLAHVGKAVPSSFPHALMLLLRACRNAIASRPLLCYFAVSQSGPALVRDLAILLVYRAARVPCLIHLHGSLLPGRMERTIKGFPLRLLLPRRTWIALTSEIAASFPRGWTTIVVPNPLPAGVKVREIGRRERDPTLKVGWLGAICREKGVDLLLLACRNDPDVDLTLAGQWGALPRETWTATYIGTLGRADALNFWSDKDVCILPSRVREGLPMTVLEALEAGVIVAVTNSLGVSALIQAGAVREVDPSVASIHNLLNSLRPNDSMESALKAQQIAWKSIRHQHESSYVRRRFQRVALSAMSCLHPST